MSVLSYFVFNPSTKIYVINTHTHIDGFPVCLFRKHLFAHRVKIIMSLVRGISTKLMFNFLSRYHIHMLYVLQFVTAGASFRHADENACLPKKSFFFARRITLIRITKIRTGIYSY